MRSCPICGEYDEANRGHAVRAHYLITRLRQAVQAMQARQQQPTEDRLASRDDRLQLWVEQVTKGLGYSELPAPQVIIQQFRTLERQVGNPTRYTENLSRVKRLLDTLRSSTHQPIGLRPRVPQQEDEESQQAPISRPRAPRVEPKPLEFVEQHCQICGMAPTTATPNSALSHCDGGCNLNLCGYCKSSHTELLWKKESTA